MFERNRVDNVPEASSVPVEVVLTNDTTIKGKLPVAVGKTLADVLNGGGGFVDFEPYGGERCYLAKGRIASVKPVGVPKAASLRVPAGNDGFDPHAILGVPAGAERENIRQAYHRLAKTYHPDRFAGADLPPEVRDYLAAMVRRLNAAYAALDVPRETASAGARATPVYATSRPS